MDNSNANNPTDACDKCCGKSANATNACHRCGCDSAICCRTLGMAYFCGHKIEDARATYAKELERGFVCFPENERPIILRFITEVLKVPGRISTEQLSRIGFDAAAMERFLDNDESNQGPAPSYDDEDEHE